MENFNEEINVRVMEELSTAANVNCVSVCPLCPVRSVTTLRLKQTRW
jgi:hypothetical protein